MTVDIAIVGGGMVGASAALALARQGYSVVLLETTKPQEFDSAQPPDLRVSAINPYSQQLLTSLDAWQHIEPQRLCAFKKMQVWEQDGAITQFDCAQIHASELGHIVENRLIQLALYQQIAQTDNIQILFDAPPSKFHFQATHNIIELAGQPSLNLAGLNLAGQPSLDLAGQPSITCRLLIGADGGQSRVRQALNIGSKGWQYAQQALAINIEMTDKQQRDTTWQQFHPSGPVAFLPMFNGFASLVWYDSPVRISELKKLDQQKLKSQIQQHFPSQLNDFSILQTASFGLARMHANNYFKGNSVLVGDAAHTINPLAGQGVNLGFKDVSALVDALSGWQPGDDASGFLAAYQKKRRADNALMMSAMDAFYHVFSNDHTALKVIRNMGLRFANSAGSIKNRVMKHALGL